MIGKNLTVQLEEILTRKGVSQVLLRFPLDHRITRWIEDDTDVRLRVEEGLDRGTLVARRPISMKLPRGPKQALHLTCRAAPDSEGPFAEVGGVELLGRDLHTGKGLVLYLDVRIRARFSPEHLTALHRRDTGQFVVDLEVDQPALPHTARPPRKVTVERVAKPAAKAPRPARGRGKAKAPAKAAAKGKGPAKGKRRGKDAQLGLQHAGEVQARPRLRSGPPADRLLHAPAPAAPALAKVLDVTRQRPREGARQRTSGRDAAAGADR